MLEDAGFTVIRAAASKGPADLVAWDAVGLRLIQVKSGRRGASPAERAAFALMPRPANATVEVWRFPDRCRHPIVERL